jgi:hypothetical protein
MNNTITIRQNYWRIPSVETAFSSWIEGNPTPKERALLIAQVEVKRSIWKPSNEGMVLVETLKTYIGERVRIQFWDSCMAFLNEGPSSLIADIVGIRLLVVQGFTQAYLEIKNEIEVPSADLYSPLVYLQTHEGSDYKLASLADLYIISKVEKETRVP